MIQLNTRTENVIAHSALALGLLALGLLCTQVAAAQEQTTTSTTTTTVEPPKPESEGMQSAFGLKGGVNWSTLYVKEAKDVNTRLGGHFGLFGRVAPTSGLGIQVELLYDQRGATFTRTMDSVDQETTYKFDYITLPVLVVIPLGEVFEIHGGGYGAAMIVSERKLEGDVANQTNDIGDGKFTPFDFGLIGGIGVNLERVQIGARYNHGLMAVANSDISRLVLDDSKNASFQLYLALALGKRD